MANRYLVGTGTRSWSDATKWSSTSGGNGGDILGVELIINGSFTGGTYGWTFLPSGVTISGNTAVFDGTFERIFQGVAVIYGSWYRLSYTVLSTNGINLAQGGGGEMGNNATMNTSTVGIKNEIFQCTGGGNLLFGPNTTGFIGTITNISLQQILTVPTSVDAVYFDVNSGAGILTLDIAAYCGGLNSSGLTSGITITSAVYSINLYGNLTENSTYSLYNFTGTAYFNIFGNCYITTNGNTGHLWNQLSISGCTVNLLDDFTYPNILRLFNGAILNTNNFTMSGFYLAYNGNATWNAGSSILNIRCWEGNNFGIFNYGTSTVNIITTNGAAFTGNWTFYNLTFIGNAIISSNLLLTGNSTITNNFTITGANSTTQRVLIQSNITGTPRIITCNGTTNITNTDFQDIIASGSTVNWIFSGKTDIGDCGGNSGITFIVSQNQYFKHTSGSVNWSNSSKWFTATNGGGSPGRVPLPQDSAIFDANSFSGSTTLTMDCPRLGSLNMSGVTQFVTFTMPSTTSCYGNFILGNNIYLFTGSILYMMGRNNYNVNQYNISSKLGSFRLNCPGGKYTLQSNTIVSGFYIIFGTIDHNNYDTTCADSLYEISGTVYLGNGTVYLSQVNYALPSWYVDGVFANIYAQGSTIKLNPNSGSLTNGFQGYGKNYNNVWFSGLHTGTFDITGSNTFNSIKIDAGRNIRIASGTTQTINSLSAIGRSGNTISISSTISGSTYTIVNPNTSYVSKYYTDYLNISDCNFPSTGMWYTGQNSTKTNNTGIIFDNYNFMMCKYSTTATPYTIKVNNMVFGSENVGYGSGFWNGIDPPISGYTIYYYTSGMTQPSIVCAQNDTDLIYWAKVYCEETTNLINSANFLNGWVNNNITVSSGITYLSNGPSFTSYKILANTTNTFHKLYKNQTALLSLNTPYNISLFAKANGYNYISLGITDDTYYQTQTIFNLTNGNVELNYTSAGGSILNSSSTYISDNWFRINLTISLTSYINNNYFMIMLMNSPYNPPSLSWSGDTTSSILISQPQIEKKDHTSLFTPAARTITNINDALLYLRNLNSVAVFDINNPGIVTSGLTLYLDAGITSSYPRSGTTWYDLSETDSVTNLVVNPSFTNLTSWSLTQWPYGTYGSNDGVIWSGNTVIVTHQSGYSNSQTFIINYYSPYIFVTGQTYTASVYCFIPSGTPVGNANIDIYNGLGWVSQYCQVNNQWTRLTATFTVTGSTGVQLRCGIYSTSNSVAYFQNYQCELGSVATPFINGQRITNNATLYNVPTYDPSYNGIFIMDGISDSINIPSLSGTNFPQYEGTISFWYYISSISGSTDYSLKTIFDDYDTTRNHIFIRNTISPNTIQIACAGNDNTYKYVVNANVPNDAWHNIVFGYRTGISSLTNFYVDGLIVSSGTISSSIWTPDSQKVGFGPGICMQGKYATLTIYNRLITSIEALQNYNTVKGRFGL